MHRRGSWWTQSRPCGLRLNTPWPIIGLRTMEFFLQWKKLKDIPKFSRPINVQDKSGIERMKVFPEFANRKLTLYYVSPAWKLCERREKIHDKNSAKLFKMTLDCICLKEETTSCENNKKSGDLMQIWVWPEQRVYIQNTVYSTGRIRLIRTRLIRSCDLIQSFKQSCLPHHYHFMFNIYC